MSKASAKVKGELPGRTNEAQKTGEAWASEAGAKIDSAVRNPRQFLNQRGPLGTPAATFLALAHQSYSQFAYILTNGPHR
jgi:hypothetical protein